ncbi:hypothetical protein FJZ26_04010 [Candidatus Parvarchaeota archaeon]|nr:hypothetical protein [Candidatus Parvarchaeota archaeon]
MASHHGGGKGDNRFLTLLFTGLLAGIFLASFAKFTFTENSGSMFYSFGKSICTFSLEKGAESDFGCWGRIIAIELVVFACGTIEILFAKEVHKQAIVDTPVFLAVAVLSFLLAFFA